MSVSIGEYAIINTQDTTLEHRVSGYRTDTTLEGVGEAPEGSEWVIADIVVRNTGDSDVDIGWTQYSVEDINGVTHSPDREAMDEAEDTLQQRRLLVSGQTVTARVIFAVEYTGDLTFVIEPYGDTDGPTVVVET